MHRTDLHPDSDGFDSDGFDSDGFVCFAMEVRHGGAHEQGARQAWARQAWEGLTPLAWEGLTPLARNESQAELGRLMTRGRGRVWPGHGCGVWRGQGPHGDAGWLSSLTR